MLLLSYLNHLQDHQMPSSDPRDHARRIWQSAVDAALPQGLIAQAFSDPSSGLREALSAADRILVMGAGKAGAAMAAAVEDSCHDYLAKIEGVVNVPAESVRQLRRIQLHAARPAGSNHPTAEGVQGSERILELARRATDRDVGLCLISGGGSALLPAPAEGITLEDKQQVTRLLHACGATINEMNTVRKHLSRIKGGRLVQAFHGRKMFSLIISDVIGDPLDAIASGPTAADPTTFADALAVIGTYRIQDRVPGAVLRYLQKGEKGNIPETLKKLPAEVHNLVVGNNVRSLAAAGRVATELGYNILNLGSYIEGETQQVAIAVAGLVRSVKEQGIPVQPPACILSGGETTVTLTEDHGLGGRNQEFVLAMLAKLGRTQMENVILLSGGTDGEDGPTEAAGAIADLATIDNAERQQLSPRTFLKQHDAFHFFEAANDLLITGLTQTNVMDVRVIIVT